MKITKPNGLGAFTLIELLAVITIILLLAGLVVGGLGFAQDKQNRDKAKVQIALLEKAIEDYKFDNGKYPGDANSPIDGNISEQLYEVLFYEGYDYNLKSSGGSPPDPWEKTINGVTVSKSKKIYLADLDPRSTKQGWVEAAPDTSAAPKENLKITDPWGNTYRYRIGTNAQNPDFDLWSIGKDGRHATGGAPAAFDPKAKDNLDDIRNF